MSPHNRHSGLADIHLKGYTSKGIQRLSEGKLMSDAPTIIVTSNVFNKWFDELVDQDQDKVMHYMFLLEQRGPTLPHPYSSSINGPSRHGPGLRELRVQSQGRPLRVFYRFDPARNAVVLLGGDKTGVNEQAFYEEAIKESDAGYDVWLAQGSRP